MNEELDLSAFLQSDEFWECSVQTNIQWGNYATGESTSEKPALFGNWNEKESPMELLNAIKELNPEFERNSREILDALQDLFELEWADEWASCSECGNFIRTSPNSYSYRPLFQIGDGEILCLDCLNYDEILEDCINNHRMCWNFSKEFLIAAGFIEQDLDFHAGIREFSEDPKRVLQKLRENCEDEFIFVNKGQEQFGMDVAVWKRENSIKTE